MVVRRGGRTVDGMRAEREAAVVSGGEELAGIDSRFLVATALLDFHEPAIEGLIVSRGWERVGERERIGGAYDFVRDEIGFGYNPSDDLRASVVLRQRLGQCNTKSTLLMALLRATGIPCRLHGFMVESEMQYGAVPRWLQLIAPAEIIHSWVEVHHEGCWHRLEGFILDRSYLASIQRKFPAVRGPFSGYAIATDDFRAPPVEWDGGDTYIQREAIIRDLGVFDSPDSFYAEHGTNLKGAKRLFFQLVARHVANLNVARLRRGFTRTCTGGPSPNAAGLSGQKRLSKRR
jgi:hypothetical protein